MKPRPIINLQQLYRHPVHLLAFGFGSGLLYPAPGTWGTITGALILLPFWQILTFPLYALLFLLFTFVVGIYLCGKTANAIGVHDHSGIVWDEFVGIWMVMLSMPLSLCKNLGIPISIILAVILFRFFDIIKPPPIKYIDQYIDGGLGIMLDDILAGLLAIMSLWIIVFLLGL